MRRVLPACALALLLAPASAHASNPPTPPLPPPTTTAPPPEHRADPSLTTTVQRLGPFTIAGYQTIRRSDAVAPPPLAGSIVGMDVRLVDANGAEIPQYEVMLHHDVFTNGGPDDSRRDGACPNNAVRERFYGTSEELRPLTLPRGYGYPSTPQDRWKTIWMVMNHRHDTRQFWVEYRTTVDPSPGLVPVRPYWLSVVPCVPDPQYSVPGDLNQGRSHRRSQTFALPEGGRVVAVGGHLHGGGRSLTLSQPACAHRTLAVSEPLYAPPGDPLYGVKPLLHEPDPKNISWHQWSDGWAVHAGDELKVTAEYEGSRPHMRVMGIAHVYVARDPAVPAGCGAVPAAGETLGASFTGRLEPPLVRLTLARLERDGYAHPIARPPGRVERKRGDARVLVENFAYKPARLSVPAGATVRWRFRDVKMHDATVASGPRGFGTRTTRRGQGSYRFSAPGTYRIYCSIHPVLMAQEVRVRRERTPPQARR